MGSYFRSSYPQINTQEIGRIPDMLSEILKLRIKTDNTLELLMKSKDPDAKTPFRMHLQFLIYVDMRSPNPLNKIWMGSGRSRP